MIKKIAIAYLALAAVALAAQKPAARTSADPYGQIVSYDFKAQSDAVKVITDEVQTAKPETRAAIEAKLLKTAEAPGATFACKSFVSDMLRVVGSKASLPLMTKWLEDPKTADLALQALQGRKEPEVTAALEQAMPKAEGKIKIALIQELAVRRDGAALEGLKTLAECQDAAMAKVALEAMGMIGTPEATAALKAAKIDKKLQVNRANAQNLCAEQMLKDGNKAEAKKIFKSQLKSVPRANIAGAALVALVQIDGPAALPAVLEAMKDKRAPLALRAAAIARGIKGDSVTGQLCEALPSLQPAVQVALLRTLRERGDKAAYPAVQTALKSGDEAVKCEAILACQMLGDAATVEPLLQLAAGDGNVAKAAKEVLGKINQPGVDEKLLAQLGGAKANEVDAAAKLLVARGCTKATPKLMELAASQDRAIRRAALTALQSFAGSSEVPALLALLSKASEGERRAVTDVLWQAKKGVPKEKRFTELWQAAPEGDKNARLALLTLASQSGGKDALEVVKEYLKEQDPKTQDIVYRALFAWPDETAAPEILQVLKTTDKLNYRVLAARALASKLADRKVRMRLETRRAMLNEALAKLERPEDKQTVQFALDKLNNRGKK